MQLLLTLLRIVGILILAVILLVLLVVLLVLLVPVRYQVWAESKAENSLYAKVRVHWLLHLISLTAEYRDELTYRLKILGITVFDEKKAKADKENTPGGDGQAEVGSQIAGNDQAETEGTAVAEEKAETAGQTSGENSTADAASSGAEPPTVKADQRELDVLSDEASPVKVDRPNSEERTEADSHATSQSSVDESDSESTPKKSLREKLEATWIKVMEFIASIPERIAVLLEKWADFQENVGERVDALIDKIDELNRKKDRLMRQLQDEQNQFAVKEIFRTLGKLLKHIRPQKLKVKGRLGFDDPAQTGQVFGIIGMLMPIYGEHIQLEAVFDEKIMEGELYLSGRIRIGTLLWLAIRLMTRREVRRLIAQVRKLADGSKRSENQSETKASRQGNDKK